MCKGIITSDSVVTEDETGGWHRGRTKLFTASEDKDHIAFHNDHFKHDMYDGQNENEKIDEETKRIESTDSETMPFVAVEIAEVTGEEHPERSTMNDDADNEETTNEAGGRHCGRSVLRTVGEDEDFIAIHNDLVEHDKDDGVEEKNQAASRGSESTSTETVSTAAVVIAGETGDEHSDRITANLEADRIEGEGHARTVPGEEEGERAAARETEEISGKDAEIRRVIEERRSTPKEEEQRLKEVSKCIRKMHQRQEKNEKADDIQRILEEFKGSAIPLESNPQRREYSSPR